jgi:hypothetical protein
VIIVLWNSHKTGIHNFDPKERIIKQGNGKYQKPD